MKLRNYLEHIAGVGIYPVITLLLFFLVFACITVWAIRTRGRRYTHAANLPLHAGECGEATIPFKS